MFDWSTCPAVERSDQRLSGAWVFRGTRVPVAALFENLEDGAQLADFVAWFPGVTLLQARMVLEHAQRSCQARNIESEFSAAAPPTQRATHARSLRTTCHDDHD